MDQMNIGKFIAQKRKEQNITQAQLAEMLSITDRAVSKWETGRAMPDSSIMVKLCEILKISVTDLLVGESLNTENKHENEKLLIEMVSNKEKTDKNMLTAEVYIGVFASIILLLFILIAALVDLKEWIRVVLIFIGLIIACIGYAFALKIEQISGYYKCKKCGHTYVPTYKEVTMAPHMGRTRYLKCPHCNQKSWQKKVLSKE